MMLKALASNYELVVAILVFVIGFCMLLFDRSEAHYRPVHQQNGP